MTNLVISITGLIISLLGLIQVRQSILLEKKTRQYLRAIFTTLIAYVVSDLVCQLSGRYLGPEGRIVSQLGLFFESAFSVMLIPQLTSFLLYSCGEADVRRNTVYRINVSLLILYLAMLIYTQFSTTIYYYDEMNIYHRGPWYPMLLIPPVLMMILNLGLLWSRRRQLTKRQKTAFAIYIVAPGVAMIIQMLVYGVYIIVFGSSVAAFFMLTYIMNDQAEQYYRQEAEIARLKNEIMLTQIQPHFVMNTLGAIAHLCHDSPEARQAIQTFSRYMRGNINVLSRKSMLSFKEEVEHTRLYLQLESLRFGESLQVKWELRETDFQIPTLTLQPLAENAVRHGVRRNPEGKGSILIASRDLQDRYEISVTDDGPGFNPEEEKNDGRSHVGIINVRERLRTICGGELKIESEPGKGTRATILLPKETGGGAA